MPYSIPTYVGAGTFTTGTAGLTVPMPAGIQAGDLLVLFAESENQNIATPTTGGTWTQIDVAQGSGTAGNDASSRIEVWYRFATAVEASVTVADSGDHTSAQILAFRGVDPSSPINISSGAVASSSASVSFSALTTTVDNCLVVYGLSSSADSATSQGSAWANASLANVTERVDTNTTTAGGGGITVITGDLATAGSTGTLTGTLAAAAVHTKVWFALRPAYTPPTVVGITYTDTRNSDVASVGYSWTGVSVGTAAADRQVFIAVYHYSGVAQDVGYVNINGAGTTQVVDVFPSGFNNIGVAIYKADVPSGTTISVDVGFYSGAAASCAIAVYRVVGARFSGFVTGSDAVVSGSTFSTSVTIPPYGGAIAAAQCVTTSGLASTWTGITKDADIQVGSSPRGMASASKVSVGETTTFDVTFTNYSLYGTQVVAVFEPMPYVEVAPASFNLTNQNVDKLYSRVLPVDVTAFNLTNQNVVLNKNTIMAVDTTAFNLTNQNVNLTKGYSVVVDTTAYTLTNQNVNLFDNRVLSVTPTAYTQTNQNVNLLKNKILGVTAASYALTHQNVDLLKNKRLSVSPAAFLLTLKGIGVGVNVPLFEFDFNKPIPTYVGEDIPIIVNVPGYEFTAEILTAGLAAGASVEMPTMEFNLVGGANVYQYEIIESCSGEQVPLSHMQDSRKLEADAYIDLFEILLSDNSARLCLKMNKTGFWQGNYYEGTGIKIEGVASYADEQVSRPKLTIWNPDGVFSALVNSGVLENAKIFRIRILKEHFENDIPIFRRQQWRVSRVASLKTPYIALELRDMLDGQNFLTPGRMFIPPDFPSVSLQ